MNFKNKYMDFSLLIILIISGIFAYIFSYYSIMKYLSLNASGYDLGIQVQIYASTMHGKLFYSNLIGESLLAEHFSPFVFIIYIFYYFFPSPKTLLIMQGMAISFSAVPLFLISRKIIGKYNGDKSAVTNTLSLAVSFSYLLSPLTESPISFDFHTMIFFNLFFFLSYYFFLKKKYLLDAVFMILIISLHSSYSTIVFFMIISQYIIANHLTVYNFFKIKNFINYLHKKSTFIIIPTLAVTILYFIFIPLLKGDINGNTASGNAGAIVTTGLPSGSIIGLFLSLFTNPHIFISYLTYDFSQKLSFITYAFASTAFLSFLSPITLIATIPYFVFSLFSKYPSYYQLGYQYTVMLIPVVFLSTAYGISRLFNTFKDVDSINYKRIAKKISVFIIVIIFVGTVLEVPMDPIAPHSIFVGDEVMVDLPTYHTNNGTTVAFALKSVIGKSDPYLLTTNNLFPTYANDVNAYVIFSDSNNHLTGLIKNYSFEYIVTQPHNFWATQGSPSLNSLTSNSTYMSHYGIYMESSGNSGVIVYKHNYTGKPVSALPHKQVRPATSFSPASVGDMFHGVSYGTSRFGLYLTLNPGKYNATYDIENINSITNSNINFDVTTNPGAIMLAHREIYAHRLPNNTITKI